MYKEIPKEKNRLIGELKRLKESLTKETIAKLIDTVDYNNIFLSNKYVNI